MSRNPKRADGDGESGRTRVAFPLIQVHTKPVRSWDLQAMSDTTKLNDWCRTWQVIDWVALVLVLLQASTMGGLFRNGSWPAVFTTTEALCWGEPDVSLENYFPKRSIPHGIPGHLSHESCS
jgi:hypothetical protein